MRRFAAVLLFACSLAMLAQAGLMTNGIGKAKAAGCNPLTDVAGIKFWLKIETLSGTTNGANVTAWNDSSANGVNYTGAANLPTYSTTSGPSGGPAVVFASGQFLNSAAQTQTQPFTFFLITQATLTAITEGVWGTAATTNISASTSTIPQFTINAGSTLAGGTPDGAWHTWAAIFNGASSVLYIDGGAAKASGAAGSNAFSSATMTIGKIGGVINYVGNSTDYLLYSGALTTAQINTVANCIVALRGMTWSPAL